ncbi:hypothetical protein ACFQX6_26130 [Streptosporangium lutulentum]
MRVRMDPGSGCGGLAVRLDERHHYRIEATADEVRCLARIGPLAQSVATRPVETDGPVVLVIDIDPGPASDAVGTPPDVVRLGVEEDGRFTPLAELDGRYLSTEVAGGFTGRVIGVYAAEGTVAFDWYEYTGTAARQAGDPYPSRPRLRGPHRVAAGTRQGPVVQSVHHAGDRST